MSWFCEVSGRWLSGSVLSGANQKVVRVWIGLLGVLCLCGAWSGTVSAGEPGSIQGVVQRGGQGVAEHRIMLIRFGPNQEVQRTPGQTDAQGGFVFDHLDTGEQFQYTVGIRVEGQLYRSATVKLESGQHQKDVLVEVAQGTAQTLQPGGPLPPLYITNHLMVMALRDGQLHVREIVNLRYTGSEPYTGPVANPGHAKFSLYFPLPQGYQNLRNVQGLEASQVHSLPTGLVYAAPLDPGEHHILYEYSLPFRDDMQIVFTSRPLPTAVFDVFVEETNLTAASDLQFSGRVAAAPHAFWHFRGTDLAEQTRSWLQLTRRTATTPLLRVGTYGLILGIALLGIAIPCYGAWRGRTQHDAARPILPTQSQELQATRIRLLQTIARLDDQHEAGALDEDTYQQQRHIYKQQLVELVEHLHYSQQDKEDNP
jgi:hypothetical protein